MMQVVDKDLGWKDIVKKSRRPCYHFGKTRTTA